MFLLFFMNIIFRNCVIDKIGEKLWLLWQDL